MNYEGELVVSENMARLGSNRYPGRGMIIGRSDIGQDVAAYWIMGRRPSSRDRLLDLDRQSGIVKTEPYKPIEDGNEDLLVYPAIRPLVMETGVGFIVSNGRHTDVIHEILSDNTNDQKNFMDAMDTQTFEPDSPIFTPRIAGILTPNYSYGRTRIQMGIIKRVLKKRNGIDRFDGLREYNVGDAEHWYFEKLAEDGFDSIGAGLMVFKPTTEKITIEETKPDNILFVNSQANAYESTRV